MAAFLCNSEASRRRCAGSKASPSLLSSSPPRSSQLGRSRVIRGCRGPHAALHVDRGGFNAKQAFQANFPRLLVTIGGTFEVGTGSNGIGFLEEAFVHALVGLFAIIRRFLQFGVACGSTQTGNGTFFGSFAFVTLTGGGCRCRWSRADSRGWGIRTTAAARFLFALAFRCVGDASKESIAIVSSVLLVATHL